MNDIQQRGAKAIAGAFKSIVEVALDVKLRLLPIVQCMEQILRQALVRLISSSTYKKILRIKESNEAGKMST